MEAINLNLIILLLFGAFAIGCISLLQYMGTLVFLPTIAGVILGVFAMLQKELAYFDDERLVDFRSTDLFKRKFKRTAYRFSEMQQVERSFYYDKGGKMVLWKFLLRDGTQFKIRMSHAFHGAFIDGLTLRLQTEGVLKLAR